MDTLFLITARGGSKGVPGKNIKRLGKKPLLHYSIDIARQFVPDSHICVSTDSEEIIKCAEEIGLKVPFIRPAHLASDTAGSYEVVKHAFDHYQKQHSIKTIVLLQPTSPFRLKKHVQGCLSTFDADCEMVVSVKKTRANPYQLLFEQKSNGYIEKVLAGNKSERRQDLPDVFELNGAVYVYNAQTIIEKHTKEFTKIKHFEMPEINSVDIDTALDWAWAEFLLEKNLIIFDYE